MAERLAFIINTARYERVAFALGVASAAAAIGRDVRLLFGHGGVGHLKKDSIDQVDEETGAMAERIKLGLETGRLRPISELLDGLRKLGGKIYACPEAMELHDVVRKELVDNVDEVRSVVRFVTEDAQDAMLIYV